MWIRPDLSSGLPVYLQLVAQVKHDLRSGALRPGETLPGVGHLATELVVNPNAVERAYRALEREGVLDRRGDGGVLRAASALPSSGASGPDDTSALTRELDAARVVQQRLLPQEYPAFAGVDYAGYCRPALAVGGDYYDFIRLSDTQLAIAIADVCGKGVPAALLMATLRAFLRGQTLQRVRPLEVVHTLNGLMCASLTTNRFATLFYGVYDTAAATLTYVNAGHPPPLVCRSRAGRSTMLRLCAGGPVVGVDARYAYDEARVPLQGDDVVVAFTDGVTEAMNAAGDEWGDEALARTVHEHHDVPPRALIACITSAADAFAGAAPQHDDLTVIALRIGGLRHAHSA